MTLASEFSRRGLKFSRQVPIEVCYKGDVVGEYFSDFLVSPRDDSGDPDGLVIVEVKAMIGLTGSDEAQLLNYLKATGKDVGLILNFGKKAEVRRRVF